MSINSSTGQCLEDLKGYGSPEDANIVNSILDGVSTMENPQAEEDYVGLVRQFLLDKDEEIGLGPLGVYNLECLAQIERSVYSSGVHEETEQLLEKYDDFDSDFKAW